MAQPPPPYSATTGQAGYPPAKMEEAGAGYPPAQQGYPAQPYPQQPAYPQAQAGYAAQPAYPQQAGYPAQPGYPGTATSQQTTTIIQQPNTVVVGAAVFSDMPTSMTCPNCHSTIVTAVRYEPGTLTWLACLGLCIVGCDLGCCFIPFCVDGMQDAVHICPACQRQLGVYRRM